MPATRSGLMLVPYRNPFRAVSNLTAERIDMGVDYGGSGPCYAIGPGVITSTYNSGWGPPNGAAPGAFCCLRFTAGPLAGMFWYVAEGMDVTVQVGQRVGTSTIIGHLTGGGIETGFAAPPGDGNAAAGAAGEFSGGNTTAYGAAASAILAALGAPPGIPQNKPPTGQVDARLAAVVARLPEWKAVGGAGPPGTGLPGLGAGAGAVALRVGVLLAAAALAAAIVAAVAVALLRSAGEMMSYG